jgi:hypothetical protein
MTLQGKSADYLRAPFIPSAPFPGVFVSPQSLRWQRRALAAIHADLDPQRGLAITRDATRDLLRRRYARGRG